MTTHREAAEALFYKPEPEPTTVSGYCNKMVSQGYTEIYLVSQKYCALVEELKLPPDAPLAKYRGAKLIVV